MTLKEVTGQIRFRLKNGNTITGDDYRYILICPTGKSDSLNSSIKVVTSNMMANDLMLRPDILCDRSIKPKPDSKLYIVPPCKYALDSIRHNYQIKRKPDDADYIVFSKASFPRPRVQFFPGNYYGYTVYISHGSKLVVIDCRLDSYSRVNYSVPPRCPDLATIKRDVEYEYHIDTADLTCWFQEQLEDMTNANEDAVKLLLGELNKPAVYVDDLDFDTGNKLTESTVTMMLTAMKAESSDENEKNLKTMLEAFNQYDWRDYPLTLRTMRMLALNTYGSVYYARFSRCYSRLPKSIRELVKAIDGGNVLDDVTEKDYNMGKSLIDSVLGEVPKFVTVNTLESKLSSLCIPKKMFDYYYDSIVRITPKSFTNKQ